MSTSVRKSSGAAVLPGANNKLNIKWNLQLRLNEMMQPENLK